MALKINVSTSLNKKSYGGSTTIKRTGPPNKLSQKVMAKDKITGKTYDVTGTQKPTAITDTPAEQKPAQKIRFSKISYGNTSGGRSMK